MDENNDAVRFAELKALAEKATRGPWAWWTSNSYLRLSSARGGDGDVLHGAKLYDGQATVDINDANRDYIAAANPAAILALIAAHAAQSEALAGKDAIIAKFGELAAAYRTEVDKKAERITELETECESLSALANRLDTVLAEYESNPAQQPGERSDLHAAIMNLPCKPLIPDTGLDPVMAHKIGHRDARHAAAELVAAAEGDAIAAARPSAPTAIEQNKDAS